MRIVDHRLVDAPTGIALSWRQGVVKHFPFEPRVAVVHYAVTNSLDATYRAMNHRGFFAHVAIDCITTPEIIQCIPFNQRGAHCGESHWNGVDGVNRVGLGIEIANPGPLEQHGDELRTVYGARWNGPVYEDPDCFAGYRFWAGYTDGEVDLVMHVTALWQAEYGIEDVVGHSGIAPGRKIDPGPAFPLETVREAVFGRRAPIA